MKKKHKKSAVALIIIIVLVAAFLADGLWCNLTVGLSKINISSEKIAESSSVRIAQVSDLHNAEFGNRNERLLKVLRESEPDLIAITGDIIDAHRTDIDIAVEFAKSAAKIAPCYYVAGNHEARSGKIEQLEDGLKAAGVIILDDKMVEVEAGSEKINIAGLYDPMFDLQGDALERTPKMFVEKLREMGTKSSALTVLLSHRPEEFDAYLTGGVDVVLTGHAHGGQIRLPFVGGVIAPNQGFFPKYDAGLYSSGGTSMVVSRGLGNSVAPLRINNRAEVVLITISGK